MPWEHEDAGDLNDSEDPDPQDADWNPDPDEVDCPYCGKEISEESERCPHCGSYISLEDAPRKKRWWILLATLALLLATLVGYFGWSSG